MSAESANRATPLTTAVLRNTYYGDEDQTVLVNTILGKVFDMYSGSCTSEDIIDFLIAFRPRIIRMIAGYEFYGVPFEHYLMHAARLYLVKYRYQQRRKDYYISNSVRYDSDSLISTPKLVTDDILPYLLEMIGSSLDALPLNPVQRKRVLIISCKLVHWLTIDHIYKIADVIKVKEEYLLLMMETIRVQLAKHFTHYETHVEHRNQLYAQLMQEYYDRRYVDKYAYDDATLHERSHVYGHDRLHTLRKRLGSCNDRIDRSRIIPSNRIVAMVSGIPKGTVDTTLSILKKKYGRLSQFNNMRYTY